jgi:F420H(2)-dependent quinone reductase
LSSHGRAPRLLVYASQGGTPTDPDWYLKPAHDPHVAVEVGPERDDAIGTPLEVAEHDREFVAQAARVQAFGEYQGMTTRVIPVVALRRAG